MDEVGYWSELCLYGVIVYHSDNIMNGILLIDKPENVTSHNVVEKIRRRFNFKRVGHSGTLDPIATGLLVILIGKATRLSEFIVGHDKEYEVRMVFGQLTDTFDRDGVVIQTDNKKISGKVVERVFSEFPREYNQVPPRYSARKVGGKEAYKLAREGKDVNLFPRRVRIYELEVLEYNWPEVYFRTKVSAGTYIRSLVVDLAKRCNTVAYVENLRRIQSGDFRVEDAFPLDRVLRLSLGELDRIILPMEKAVIDLPEINLNNRQMFDYTHGRFMKFSLKDGRYRVMYEGRLIGVCDVANGRIISRKVF